MSGSSAAAEDEAYVDPRFKDPETKYAWVDELDELLEYTPSEKFEAFHDSSARIRIMCCGIKSGKTFGGAKEFTQCVGEKAREAKGARRRRMPTAWIVAPTNQNLDEAEEEMDSIFARLAEKGWPILKRKYIKGRMYLLEDGTKIKLKSGEVPKYLRGPNLDVVWIDEAGFLRQEAWTVLRGRIIAKQEGEDEARGVVLMTTTPDGYNWFWNACLRAGMPEDAPYGEWESDCGKFFVSHWPTWEFPWVPEDEIEELKKDMSKLEFDVDLGAMFSTSAGQVFGNLQKNLTHNIAHRHKEDRYVAGLDLAKEQDWTVWIVMDGSGRVMNIERWTGLNWILQKDKVEELSRVWGYEGDTCPIVLDKANVGSSIHDDLVARGLHIYPIDMNSAQVKIDLIQALQDAMDHSRLKIPNDRGRFATDESKALCAELRIYRSGLTPKGKLTYGAPRKKHDDCVVSLALANWGRMRGFASSANQAHAAAAGRDEVERLVRKSHEPDARQRRRATGSVWGRGRRRLWKGVGA